MSAFAALSWDNDVATTASAPGPAGLDDSGADDAKNIKDDSGSHDPLAAWEESLKEDTPQSQQQSSDGLLHGGPAAPRRIPGMLSLVYRAGDPKEYARQRGLLPTAATNAVGPAIV